jgi:hypothetical protein
MKTIRVDQKIMPSFHFQFLLLYFDLPNGSWLELKAWKPTYWTKRPFLLPLRLPQILRGKTLLSSPWKLSLLSHLIFSVLLLFDIHVHYFPVVSLLVTDLCTLNLVFVFFTHTSSHFSHLCYSCFPFHFFAFSNSFIFSSLYRVFPHVLLFVCFVSNNSLHLHTFVIYFHNIILGLIIQLVCPLLESTASLFYFILKYFNIGSLYFLPFTFQLNFIRPFQVHFLLS